MNKRFAVLVVAASAISGCSTFSSPAKQEVMDAGTGHWISYDATRRGTVVVPSSAQIKTCSEPSPDVALSMVSKLEGTVKKEEAGEATGKAEFNASVVKLAERTQMVMFLRESLFRLCEQSINHQFTKDEVLTAYSKTIDAAMAIVVADRAKAETEAAKAEAEKAKAQANAAMAIKSLTPEQLRAIQ
jgi:hypothetical protein